MSEHFDDFKRNLNNPYNIKDFYKLLNEQNIKDDANPGEIVKKKVDTKGIINDLLAKAMVNSNKPKGPTSLPNAGSFTGSSNASFNSVPSNVDFIKLNDYSSVYKSSQAVSTLEKQLEDIELSTIKSRIKELLKEIKIADKDFDCELYVKFMNNPETDQHNLNKIRSILENELGGYEGRSFVTDIIIAGTGLLEGHFDGTKSVLGYNLDLTGLSDTFDLSLRKRKIETAAIYRQGKESLGLGPISQLAIDLLVNTVITAQKNSGKSNETQKAIKLRERLNS
jgi:hypothetical protein